MSISLAETTKLLSEFTDKKSNYATQIQPLRFMADFSLLNASIDDVKYKDIISMKKAGVDPYKVAKVCLEFINAE